MWWVDQIFSLVWDISGFFYDAYTEVQGWIWPFYLLYWPLYLLYNAFRSLLTPIAHFSDWTRDIWNKIQQIFSLEQITAYFRTWIDAATNAWNWVVNSFWNVWNIVESWWSSAKYTVLSWIDTAKYWLLELIAATERGLAQLREDIQWFFDNLMTFSEIIQWWVDWGAKVKAAIIRWGFATLLDVAGLIATAFLEREDFWAGWQDFRGMVADFFQDPLEFLLTLFTDWFLGPEE